MPKCKIKGCQNHTRYKNTTARYCSMHLARIKRNGNTNLKIGSHALEKIPHELVDDYILKNQKHMIDSEIAKDLINMGYIGATQWIVKYRRRKLGIKKYLYGDVKKHKAWIRSQAIKKYGNKCELCGYSLSIDIHHIKPKNEGGSHEISNLMVLCPNCHALITRKIFTLNSRKDILKTKKIIRKTIQI